MNSETFLNKTDVAEEEKEPEELRYIHWLICVLYILCFYFDYGAAA